MNLSQFNRDERRTRDGYKDNMKRQAFELMKHAAASLNLHDVVVQEAQVLFAGFRNVREHVHKFRAVVAACIIDAWRSSGRMMHEGG